MKKRDGLIIACCAVMMATASAFPCYWVYTAMPALEAPGFRDLGVPQQPEFETKGDPGEYALKSTIYSKLNAEEKQAFLAVANAPLFTTNCVGMGCSQPIAVKGYCVLCKSQYAKEIFTELVGIANPAGKAYALCALYYVYPSHFKSTLMKTKLEDYRCFNSGSGCTINTHETIATLYDALLDGSLASSLRRTCSEQ